MSIFCLELRTSRRSALLWTLFIGAVILLLLSFYPSMKTEAMQALADAKLENISPAVLAVLGLAAIPDFTVITNYFGYVLQFIVLAFAVFAVNSAVRLLVKEEGEGTVEFLYSKPVSRTDIFIQKVLSHLALCTAMVLCFAAVTVTGYMLFSDFRFAEAVRESLIFYSAVLFIAAVFSSVGFLVSAVLKNSRSSSGAAIGIVFGTFVLGAVSAAAERFAFLIYFSPMDWIKVQKLMTGGIRPAEFITGIIICIVCPAAAYRFYMKKDLLC